MSAAGLGGGSRAESQNIPTVRVEYTGKEELVGGRKSRRMEWKESSEKCFPKEGVVNFAKYSQKTQQKEAGNGPWDHGQDIGLCYLW